MSSADLGDYFRLLEEFGWSWEERRGEDGSRWWKASSAPPYPACHLRATCNQGYVLLEVPLAVTPLASCQAALWRYLLQLNGALKVAKFALGPGDGVVLATEFPSAGSTFAAFRDAVTSLRTYGAYFRQEIEVLSSQPPLAHAWMSLRPQREETPVQIVSLAREA
jgi:hypothetical protein